MSIKIFDILAKQEELGKSNAKGLPEIKAKKTLYSVLTFLINKENHATLLENITEVITKQDITNIPATREWLTGITTLRGDLLPIVDLSCLLTGIKTKIDHKNKILVVKNDNKSVGLVVGKTCRLQKKQSIEEIDIKLIDVKKITSDLEFDLVKFANIKV